MAIGKINELKFQLYQCEQSKPNTTSLVGGCSSVQQNLSTVLHDLQLCQQYISTTFDTCQEERVNLSIVLNNCIASKLDLNRDISNLKDAHDNATLSLNACRNDNFKLNSSVNKCNDDLRGKLTLIAQSNTNLQQVNQTLYQCSVGRENLTKTLHHCNTSRLQLISERDVCTNDVNNMTQQITSCLNSHHDLSAASNLQAFQLAKCKEDLARADVTSYSELIDLQQKHGTLNVVLADYKHKIDIMKSGFLQSQFEHQSNIFNGRRYFLSRPVTANLTRSHNTCRALGGTLAEINSQAEFSFIENFISNARVSSPKTAMLGATDLNSDNRWEFYSSGQAVNYFRWAQGQPDRGWGQNCMYLVWDHSAEMHDGMCHTDDVAIRVICELSTGS